jgi:hypothetical protein
MIRSFLNALEFKRKQWTLHGDLFNGVGMLAAVLSSFTPQPTSASQTSVSSGISDTSGSENNSHDEWVVFYEKSLSTPNRLNASDSYAIKRNELRTGFQTACAWVPIDPKNPPKKYCGSSVVWVKGDHSKNPSVQHRTSLTRYGIKCNNWEYSKDQYISYSARGDIIHQWEKLGQLRAIIPGIFEERIARTHCTNPH